MPLLLIACMVILGASASHPPTAMCRNHPGTGFNKSNLFLKLQPLSDTSAKCNDGSSAHIYFRPCCNGDDPGDFCNASIANWFIVFGDGNQDGWCWDVESCARRALQNPALTSAAYLPEYFNRSGDSFGTGIGAFSKSGEGNPNFYKAYAAYIPYCSSDLFLGDCDDGASKDGNSLGKPTFCGKSIAKAAMKDLVVQMERYGADNVVLVGGAGVMTYVDELRDMIPKGAKTTAICDGCVLFDDLPPPAQPKACSDAYSCTPDRTLPAAVALWGAKMDSSCGGWRCLLSTQGQGNVSAVARAASRMPLLAQHPLYDALAFSARGTTAGANAAFAAKVRLKIEAGLAPAKIAVGSACTSPQSSFTKSSYSYESAGDGSFSFALYNLVYSVPGEQLIDSCQAVNCNPSCVGATRLDISAPIAV